METTMIREKLHQYIDNSDDKLLKLMFALANEYNGTDDINVEYDFTDEEIKEFDRRRARRLSGESSVYTWENAKKIITGR
jgi:hypothetical protein